MKPRQWETYTRTADLVGIVTMAVVTDEDTELAVLRRNSDGVMLR